MAVPVKIIICAANITLNTEPFHYIDDIAFATANQIISICYTVETLMRTKLAI